MDTFQEFSDNHKKEEDSIYLRFSFVAYLIEIYNIPAKALSEVMYMKIINMNSS